MAAIARGEGATYLEKMSRASALVLALVAASLNAQVPPRSAALPPQEVEDTVLAYLLALIVDDHDVAIERSDLDAIFPESLSNEITPFDFLQTLSREPAQVSEERAVIAARFSQSIAYDVPVDIFGYHPVHLYGSSRLVLCEKITTHEGVPVFALKLTGGSLRIDFDGWLDFIGGRLLDDTTVTHVAATKVDGAWTGLLIGESPNGRRVTWMYDFTRSKLKLRPPSHIAEIGATVTTERYVCGR